MFILRRITSEGNESNECIGDSYNYVRKVENKEEYARTVDAWIKGIDDSEIYGFVIHNNGSKIIPLYLKSTYFIMTSNGQTFANLSNK